jgi:hypothetical protein
MGFSASGMFANRFTVLHPDIVKAAAIGSPGGWPISPVGTWQGKNLRYHVGIYDLQQLINSPFNLDQFKLVPLFFFMGSADTNDSVPYSDSYSSEDRDLVNSLFGNTPIERWPKAKQIYEGIGSKCQFVLYSGVRHEISNTMKADIIKFFDDNR